MEKHGEDFYKTNLTGSIAEAAKKYTFSLRDALAIDTQYICLEADAVALLPGWDLSKGACAERALAIALGLQIIELDGNRPHKCVVEKVMVL